MTIPPKLHENFQEEIDILASNFYCDVFLMCIKKVNHNHKNALVGQVQQMFNKSLLR